jgi:hypothetical protein
VSEPVLEAVRDLIQEDVGGRGLRTDPVRNLCTVCAPDFEAACRSLATTPSLAVGIVTGFLIPHAQPPAGETDGPLGALFLARVLAAWGSTAVLVTDRFCESALRAGLAACGLEQVVPLVTLPEFETARRLTPEEYWREFIAHAGRLTHLIALERAGPSHTPESLRQQGAADPASEQFLSEVPLEHRDRCHTLRGRDVTTHMSPAHRLFEMAGRQEPPITTIGIGDGGNEIGMGKIPWEVIRRNIPSGGSIACRVPTDYLVVCGVSNWGAYGLGAGASFLRGTALEPESFDVARERELLHVMVERGPLVDGVTGRPDLSVDGLGFARYAEALTGLSRVLGRT